MKYCKNIKIGDIAIVKNDLFDSDYLGEVYINGKSCTAIAKDIPIVEGEKVVLIGFTPDKFIPIFEKIN